MNITLDVGDEIHNFIIKSLSDVDVVTGVVVVVGAETV